MQRCSPLGAASTALLNNAGNHYVICGHPEEAEALFSRLVKLNPQHVNANVQLARIALQRRDGPRALEFLARIPEETPPLQLIRAEALEYTGQHDRA